MLIANPEWTALVPKSDLRGEKETTERMSYGRALVPRMLAFGRLHTYVEQRIYHVAEQMNHAFEGRLKWLNCGSVSECNITVGSSHDSNDIIKFQCLCSESFVGWHRL